MKSSCLFVLTASSFFSLAGEALAGGPTHMPLGVNLDSLSDWSPQQMFVDLVKTARVPFGTAQDPFDDRGVPLGDDGWPLGDFGVVLSINRIDADQTYSLSFEGFATSISTYATSIIRNLSYDPIANLTTADLEVYPDTYIALGFSGVGPRVRNLKVLRPGYAPTQTFTTPFLTRLEPFQVIRFMDYLMTNANPVTTWSERTLPTSPSQARREGGAWEYAIQLANETRKDIWINIPALADDDYVLQLAQLMRANLDPGRAIYFEYSNEVWNMWPGFDQGWQNLWLARTEALICSEGGTCQCNVTSNLCAFDLETRDFVLAWRRIVRRDIQIADIFKSVYGPEAMLTTIRPVLATQMYSMTPRQQLYFVQNVYGAPSRFFVGMALHPFFGPWGSPNGPTDDIITDPNATVDQLLESMSWDIREMLLNSEEYSLAGFNSLARAFSLRMFAFEGGLDTGYYDINVERKIACSFDPRMTTLLTNYLATWSACMGDGDSGGLFNYYKLASVYGVYGQWGLTDNINLPSVKTAAIDAMMQRNPASFECSTIPYDPAAPPPGTGTGLSASYYRDPNFGQLDRTQLDSTVDFWWWDMIWAVNPAILPAQLVGAYSVVWTGAVEPKYSQTYTFYTLAEHPIRLMVNGVTLVSDQSEHPTPVEQSGTIDLQANQRYPIRIEYRSPVGPEGTVSLSWSSASQTRAKVSRSQLYPF